jgi:hypothetical protein
VGLGTNELGVEFCKARLARVVEDEDGIYHLVQVSLWFVSPTKRFGVDLDLSGLWGHGRESS